ncbi:uncharacterized protein LOC141647648 [Silene latifolia]|uniref:uncharacterized protein LOC141647648 n=1 Tax=Silene latifolia TaxID=37657 RepID=UPI003D77889B
MEEADGSGKPVNDEQEEADDGEGISISAGAGLVAGDATCRGRMEIDLEDLRDEMEAIHDQNRESSALQRAMSDMFKDMYLESYKLLEATLYAELATRRLDR